jgi:F0F1-type ATP synthase assembly protein I
LVPAGENRDRQATYEGFGDVLAHAVELVGTTVVFVLIGLWLDSRFGTRPAFLVGCALLAIVGLALREYYGYVERMKREEEGKPWTRNR